MGLSPYFFLRINSSTIANQCRRLANQEVLRWQLNMQKEIGNSVSHDDIKAYLWKTLKSGQVVPG